MAVLGPIELTPISCRKSSRSAFGQETVELLGIFTDMEVGIELYFCAVSGKPLIGGERILTSYPTPCASTAAC